MSKSYSSGAALADAKVRKEGDKWTLVLIRNMRHAPEKVWQALTDPDHLSQWAPFDANRNLGAAGPAKLTAVGAPSGPVESDTVITRAEEPKLLEYNWSGNDLRWELEPTATGGTRLTLWHNINQRYVAWGAAGWHICFDVMEHLLDEAPIGRMVGAPVMGMEGWQRLTKEYAQQFGMETK